MILVQAIYLYTHSLLSSPTMLLLLLLETFLELLLWNNFQCCCPFFVVAVIVINFLKAFFLYGRLNFWKQKSFGAKSGDRLGVLFQARDCLTESAL
jgi:hypothetical protein